eukprot:6461669-Amphidinium_carterae.1
MAFGWQGGAKVMTLVGVPCMLIFLAVRGLRILVPLQQLLPECTFVDSTCLSPALHAPMAQQ